MLNLIKVALGSKSTEDFYDRFAQQYSSNTTFSQKHIEAAKYIDSLLEHTYIAVDFGCGAGHMSLALAEVGNNHVIGVDISQSMLKVARERDEKKLVEWIHIDSNVFSFDDASIDMVLMMSVATHLKEKELIQLLRETNRILKQGGHIVVTAYPDYLKKNSRVRVYELLSILKRLTYVHNHVKTVPLAKKLSEAGFQNVFYVSRYSLLIGQKLT